MDAQVLLPLVSALISLVFAALVLDQYARRRRPYQLVWSLGLVWYAISTYAQYLGVSRGWDEATYRWWYLSGAICVAAWLGMGTVYLLAPRRPAHLAMAAVALGSLAGAALTFLAPVDAARLPLPGEPPTGEAFPGYVRFPLPVLMNVFGAVALFGGAVWSGWRVWRQGQEPQRLVANSLIALGALAISVAGTFTRFGIPAGLAWGQFLGIVLILAGFLVNLRLPRFAEGSLLLRLSRLGR